MVAVKDNSADFLKYVVKVGLGINNNIKVLSKESYDSLLTIEVNGVVSSVSQVCKKHSCRGSCGQAQGKIEGEVRIVLLATVDSLYARNPLTI